MKSTSLRDHIFRYIIIIIWGVFALFPVYWMVNTSLKPLPEWTSAGGKVYWVPSKVTFENFQNILSSRTSSFSNSSSAVPSIKHSLIIGTISTTIAVIVGTFAAYGLSRYPPKAKTKGLPLGAAIIRGFAAPLISVAFLTVFNKRLFETGLLGLSGPWFGVAVIFFFTLTLDRIIANLILRVFNRNPDNLAFSILQLRMFPPIAVVVPVVIMWSALKLVDTWYGLSLIYAILTMPFVIWLMKSFFDEIPLEVSEAAMVDGSSPWSVFLKVDLPLVKGGLATSALFVFILNWSDFTLALLLTNRNWVTIPVFLQSITSAAAQLYGPQSALGVIALIPPVIFGLLIQRYLVRGLTFGAIKR
jgi:ABC-type glycerol-3-phosphate transport system permease component